MLAGYSWVGGEGQFRQMHPAALPAERRTKLLGLDENTHIHKSSNASLSEGHGGVSFPHNL